jgi:hypothetical protein
MDEYGKLPEELGVYDLAWFEYMHYMYLPVVMFDECGDTLMRPERLGFLDEILDVCLDREGDSKRFVYVTARRGYATAGNPLNRPGWHSDGFGTEDINYIWSDSYPTVFSSGDFGDISEDHEVSIKQFTEVADGLPETTYPVKTLLRLDQFVVHRAPDITNPGERSFLKISFSDNQYNLLGNSHNYDFNYSWQMFTRDEVRNDPTRAGKDYG